MDITQLPSGAGACYGDVLGTATCISQLISLCTFTNVQQVSSCYCSNGASQWSCYSSAMVTAGCTSPDPNGPLFWEAASEYLNIVCSGSVPADVVSKAGLTSAQASTTSNQPKVTSTTPSSSTPTTTASTPTKTVSTPMTISTPSTTVSTPTKTVSTPTTTISTPTTTISTPTTTVSLYLVSIITVTPTTPISTTPHTSLPTYDGSGTLLNDHCRSSSFTLVDDVSTAFFVPFIGCDAERPECCPWTANEVALGTATPGGTVTLTATGTSTPTVSAVTVNTGPGYPVPLDAAQAPLLSCPGDYVDLGTACCPSGYLPFTTLLGGQTPCYSSLEAYATNAVTMTAGVDYEDNISLTTSGSSAPSNNSFSSASVMGATSTAKPTSAAVNIVWAMQYPKAATSNHSHGLPTAGLVGVIIGSALGLLLIVALIYLVFWRPRQKKKSQQQQQVAQQPYGQNSAGNVQPPANAYPVQFKQAYASDLNDESGKEVLDTMQSPSPVENTHWVPQPAPQQVQHPSEIEAETVKRYEVM